MKLNIQYVEEPDEEQNEEERDFSKEKFRYVCYYMAFSFMGCKGFVFALISIF